LHNPLKSDFKRQKAPICVQNCFEALVVQYCLLNKIFQFFILNSSFLIAKLRFARGYLAASCHSFGQDGLGGGGDLFVV
jgi:hypothetical protein